MPTKSQLESYRTIEKRLRVLFDMFHDLCAFCFTESLNIVRVNGRLSSETACCCLVDNQVHDYWPTLDAVHRQVEGPNWQKGLERAGVGLGDKKVIRGPCPALSREGCVLNKFRPPTCSTQLCLYIVNVMVDLGIIERPRAIPCQIEDLIKVASPLDILFGVRKRKRQISEDNIPEYLGGIERLIQLLRAVPNDQVRNAVERQKAVIQERVAYRRR